MRESADKAVLRWLDQQPRTSVWITAVTMLEIRLGLEIMAIFLSRQRNFQRSLGLFIA